MSWDTQGCYLGADPCYSKWGLTLTRAEEDHKWATSCTDKERAGQWNATTGQASWQIHLSLPDLWKYWCDGGQKYQELAPSPIILIVDGIAINPRHPDATLSVQSEVKEIDETIYSFPIMRQAEMGPVWFLWQHSCYDGRSQANRQ